MECIDMVSRGGTMQAVINTEAEYDSLISARFREPLQDYWNANYDSVLAYVRANNPGLSDSVYALLVRQIFYSFLPFRGTDTCSQPTIDFTSYTLLGQDANGGGCKRPDYQVTVFRDNVLSQIIFKVRLVEHGSCEMGFDRNEWVLVPKIPEGFRVVFQEEKIKL